MELPRRTLPITLGVVLIVLVVALIIGWVLLAIFGAASAPSRSSVFWTLLTVGTTLLVLVLLGVVFYLVLTIKAINLNRRQSNFIAAVTHELKSPIASIKLYLQTLNRRDMSEEERTVFQRSMLDDIDRLDRLINQILAAGRLDRGSLSGDREAVSLPDLLADCVDEVCKVHDVPAERVKVDALPCRVEARQVELELLFRNLIDNAVKYGGDPVEVHISMHPLGPRRHLIRVADNGEGIPAELRRKVFGRFVRLGQELTRKKPGTGLGLFIVRQATLNLKGKVRVADRPVGRGTVFEVELPTMPAET